MQLPTPQGETRQTTATEAQKRRHVQDGPTLIAPLPFPESGPLLTNYFY